MSITISINLWCRFITSFCLIRFCFYSINEFPIFLIYRTCPALIYFCYLRCFINSRAICFLSTPWFTSTFSIECVVSLLGVHFSLEFDCDDALNQLMWCQGDRNHGPHRSPPQC